MNKSRRYLLEYAVKPIPIVHIGIVGLGHRGMKAVERYALVEGAEIVALADRDSERVEAANVLIESSGRSRGRVYSGADAAKRLINDKDVDLVYICTEWRTHATFAVQAMQHGKHVAVEVPAAMTVADCEELIETSLQTQRHCMMLENCCYDTFASATRVMVKEGLLGDITHCEGAYIHDLTDYIDSNGGPDHNWMAQDTLAQAGNAYPTHSMGSIGLHMNLHRGDRMDYLIAMTSSGEGLHGRVNNTLIHTCMGRTILLQHDIGTPRPYNRLQQICGTEGFVQKYPLPSVRLKGMDTTVEGDEALKLAATFREPGVSEWIDDGVRKGSPNTMNHVMDSRLVYCLRNGLPLDMDVFDAAEWSAIVELSSLSANNGGHPVEIPDFTCGNWQVLSDHKFYI